MSGAPERRFTAAAYARVAKDDGTRSWEAVERQQQANAAAASRLGIQIVAGFVDVGSPGNRTNRPGLNHLFAQIEETPVDYVIANSIDRLSRDSRQLEYLLHRLKGLGATAIFARHDTAYELVLPSDLEVLHGLPITGSHRPDHGDAQ